MRKDRDIAEQIKRSEVWFRPAVLGGGSTWIAAHASGKPYYAFNSQPNSGVYSVETRQEVCEVWQIADDREDPEDHKNIPSPEEPAPSQSEKEG